MKYELEKKLADDFPFMRRKKDLREQSESGMIDDLYGAFGCECEDGWFDLLYGLCSEITEVYKRYGAAADIVVEQIKEKYGELRFYYGYEAASENHSNLYREVNEIIRKYEESSSRVCEKCGKPGITREELPWIWTLCDDCLAQMQAGKEC